MSNFTTSLETLSEVFQRGSANIIWCEHVLAMKDNASSSSSNDDEWMQVAEFYNTWTNLAFVIVPILGLLREANDNTTIGREKKNMGAILCAELTLMIGVGFGSFMFHAHQSRAAQVADELPMSLLMLAYNYSMRGLHPWTTDPTYSRIFYGANLVFCGGLWALYIWTGIYDLFLLCFTTQCLETLLLSYDAGRRVNHPTNLFYISVFCLVFGKALWEYERHLYRNDACEAPGTIWLHPLWHIGAALSHYYCMLNTSNLHKRINCGDMKSGSHSNCHVKKE